MEQSAQRKVSTDGDKKKGKNLGVDPFIRRDERQRRQGGEGRAGRAGRERTGKGTRGRLGWRGRAFWNGKLFLVGRRRPSWAKKEQAIYISKQPISQNHTPLYPFMENPIIFHSPTQSIQPQIILLIRSDYRSPNSTVSSSGFAFPLCPTTPTFAIDTIAIRHAAEGDSQGGERKGMGTSVICQI